MMPRSVSPQSRAYAAYAALFLCVTLLAGVWLRLGLVDPRALGGVRFHHLLHAHSHLAYFGWVSMGLFAILSAGGARSPAEPWSRWHPHLVGIASGAAFLAFLYGGYFWLSIVLSALHVVLWWVFALMVAKRPGMLERPSRPFYRGALFFLCLSGVGALLPGIAMAAGIADPWLNRLALQSFLSPFTAGWITLGAMGAVYAGLRRARFRRPVLWAAAAGVVPSGLLHAGAGAPAEWVLLVGRAGTALAGFAALLFALDVLRERRPPLLMLAGAAALLRGVAELLVGAGVGVELIGSRPLVIAYLHLLLLGLVTPVLVQRALPGSPAAGLVRAHALGLAAMLTALAVQGLPAGPGLLASAGWGLRPLLLLALAGGSLSALSLLGMVLGAFRPATRRGDFALPSAPVGALTRLAGARRN